MITIYYFIYVNKLIVLSDRRQCQLFSVFFLKVLKFKMLFNISNIVIIILSLDVDTGSIPIIL